MSYTTEQAIQSSDQWAYPNGSHLQTHFYTDTQQPRAFYKSGEVSPVPDDSAGTYYDSPQPYEHAQLADSYNHGYYEQLPASLVRSGDAYNAIYGFGQASPVALDDTEGCEVLPSYTQDYCGNSVQEKDSYIYSPMFSIDATTSDYQQRFPHYLAKQQQLDAPMQPAYRSESPMGHLPYQCPDLYGSLEGYASSSSFESSDTSRRSSIERPQPQYPNADRSLRLLAHHPTPVSVTANRSLPIAEYMLKKPLTLACFFCKKRKIACGGLPPGKKDRTCK